MIKVVKIRDSQTQFPRSCNMPRATIEQILTGIVKELLVAGGYTGGIVLP